MAKTVQVPEPLREVFDQAEEAVSAYFSKKSEVPERGHIDIDGERYILVRAASLANEFYDMMTALYDGRSEQAHPVTRNLLFHMAHFIGRSDARAFHAKLGLEEPVAKLSAGPVHFAHTGWAFVDILPDSRPSADQDYFIVYDHPYSFESTSWQQAGRTGELPVCLMNAGYSSGWCEESFGVELSAAEILCMGRGDDRCRFVMAPPGRLQGRIDEYLAQYPEVAAMVRDYEIPGSFERRALEERLEATQLRYSRLFEKAGDGIVLLRDGVVTEMNPRARELYRVDDEAVIGKTPEELIGIWYSEEDQERIRQALEAAATGAPQHFPLTVNHSDGSKNFVDVSLSSLDDDAGLLMSVIRDITEQEAARRERRMLEAEVRQLQKMEAVGTLAGGIAHDFNNLLTSVLGNLSLISAELPDSGSTRSALEDVRLALDRASTLARKLLTFARTSQKVREAVRIDTVVQDSLRLLGESLDRRMRLTIEPTPEPLFVMGDVNYLGQVLMNLLLNARDALVERLESEGTGAFDPGITVRFRHASLPPEKAGKRRRAPADEYVILEVEDNGAGMHKTTAARAFEAFFTTKPVGKGSGLGLYTAFSIIQQHEGRLELSSTLGEGTTVTILLPRVAEDAPPASLVSLEVSSLTGASLAGTETILLVDDESLLRRFAVRALTGHGYTVLEAEDGVAALELWTEHASSIDLVILDLTMPRLSGPEVMAHLLEQSPELPIVISTGYSTQGHSEEVLRQGAAGYLSKPYDAEKLLKTVRGVLDGG